ncbi:MAG: hypothetical protein JWQ28_1801 [Pedobacter sp.]|jgi:hypothetical protein|nr:hypothetical protein [Pedobacter sp.]
MIRRLKVYGYLLFGLIGFNACSTANNKPLSIEFSSDSTKILVRNIDPAGLHQLQAMGNPEAIDPSLIAVLDTPSDEDSTSQEQQVPGKIRLVKDMLEFRPEQPFRKGRQYLIVSYLNVRFGNLQSALKGTMHNSVKPNQKILKR